MMPLVTVSTPVCGMSPMQQPNMDPTVKGVEDEVINLRSVMSNYQGRERTRARHGRVIRPCNASLVGKPCLEMI